MTETRKIAAILAADVVGYSRLTGTDEDRTLARLRALRSDLIDPTIAVHNGRVVKRTGDGALVEFRSVVDAVRCAIEVQNGMLERNAGLPPERRIDFRIGIHLGDIVEESDGSGRVFSYIAPEARVPSNHPLRKIRILVRDVLGELNRSLGKLYASEGRPSIPPTSFSEEEIFDGDGHAVDKAKGEPFAQRRSDASASASALSRATSTKALILGSSRTSTVFVTSTGDSVLRRYASTSSLADRNAISVTMSSSCFVSD